MGTLTTLKANALSKPGMHADGDGLYLNVTTSGTKSWVLRVMIDKKRTDRGLGSFKDVPLAVAREKARELRAALRHGIDPKKEVKAKPHTFREAAGATIKAMRSNWKNSKHAQQWNNTLEAYVYPHIGHKNVADVGWSDVLTILGAIWLVKNETAQRVRGRIEAVLDYAMAHGWRPEGLNPAAKSAKLKAAFPTKKRAGVAGRRGHHAAMPWADVPAFMHELQTREGVSPRALEFLILSACRSGEVRLMAHEEVHGDVWVIPATRMKAGQEHRVPLTPRMLELTGKGEGLVFPGAKGKPMSDMSMSAVMRRMQQPFVPHGFRSSFRDWAAEATSYPRELAEKALAHTLTNDVEAAYQRGDMLLKRREMMLAWERFVLREEVNRLRAVA